MKKTTKILGLLTFILMGSAHSQTLNTNYEHRLYGGYNIHQNFDKSIHVGVEKKLYDFENSKTKLWYALEYHKAEFKGNTKKGFEDNNSWVTASPLLQHYISNDFYLKGGVGVAYIENLKFGRKRTGSHWQFAVNMGVGYEINDKWNMELKWRHYSNGNTANPNPGRDFIYIDVGYKF